MTYIDFIGIAGATIILVFFILDQAHKISPDEKTYDFFNFLGSGLLILYSVLIDAWPFTVLNTVWALYSLRDLLKK
jgi:hypothetical protein